MNLKQIRLDKKVRLSDIAEKCNCSISTIYLAEKGQGGGKALAYLKWLGLSEVDITRYHSGSMQQMDIEDYAVQNKDK